MKPLSIGQVARLAGLGVETVRFYERLDLIGKPPRRESGYRQYSQDVVSRLRFIKRARDLGFSLKEVKELLSLRLDPDTTCSEVCERVETTVLELDRKIRDLQKMRDALDGLKQLCLDNDPSATECPLLDALENFGEEEN